MFMVKDVFVCVNIGQIPKTSKLGGTNSWLRFCSESLVYQGDVYDGDPLLVLGVKNPWHRNIKSFV